MSRVTKRFGVVAAVGFAMVLAATAAAGDWSAEQKEVWSSVTAYWDEYAAGDVDGFLSYMHEDYSGWGYEQPLPTGKESSRKWMAYAIPLQKIQIHEVTPVGINIHGDVAVVHYYYAYAYRDPEGKPGNEQGRWTDILVKQGAKWVLFADHGGSTEDDD
jgi:ketosteroid isomerase-like protein